MSVEITQQEATIKKYHKMANRIVIEFTNATGRDWRLHPMRLIEWVGDQRPRWPTATWRVYRAAMTSIIRNEFPGHVNEAIKILNCASATLPAKPQKARRLKKLLPEHMALLVAHATSRSSPNLSLAILMLRAGEIVGLRPHEWFGARCEANAVIVQNSKHTNGRAFGPIRTIQIEGVSVEENEAILRLIELANSYTTDEAWLNHVQTVRVTLGRATAAIGIQGLHLYSARHQFSANAKLAGLSNTEIAALMGHASNETAATHYGRRSAGRAGGLKIRPDATDVATVAGLNANRSPRGYTPPGQGALPLAREVSESSS